MLLIIRSTDIINNNVKLSDKFEGKYQLHSFIFTNNIYNITSKNNILPYYESSLNNIELTQQYANGPDLATHLQTKINAVSAGTASVSFDSNTGKFTITNTTNFSLKFGDNTNNTCHELIGFTQANTSTNTTITSDNISQLVPFNYITIKIDQDRTFSIHNQSYHNDTLFIIGKSDFGDTFIYNNKDYTSQYIKLKPTKQLSISFYDHKHNSIDIANWTLVLMKC